ncbi:unnamed protein product, partial [Callosobruchus maculatus]
RRGARAGLGRYLPRTHLSKVTGLTGDVSTRLWWWLSVPGLVGWKVGPVP